MSCRGNQYKSGVNDCHKKQNFVINIEAFLQYFDWSVRLFVLRRGGFSDVNIVI